MNRPVPGPLRPAGAGEARGISQLFPVSPGALTGSPDMAMRSGPGRAMASGHANRALPGRCPGRLRSASLLIEASRRGRKHQHRYAGAPLHRARARSG